MTGQASAPQFDEVLGLLASIEIRCQELGRIGGPDTQEAVAKIELLRQEILEHLRATIDPNRT
jgi:hypothetical protein